MKNIIYILSFIALAIVQTVSSQNIGDLDGIYYQAVALDDDPQEIVGMDVEAKPLFNREISITFTITKELNGDIQWEETHTVTTDKYGLFSLVIGKGDVSSTQYASLLDLPWIDANQFLKVEISTKNDNNYKMVSNQKFMAVPYAFYADDIADDAITTAKILNEEIINEDIATGAVETSEILNETVLNEDIATSAVETSEILNETIIAEDIAIGAVETSEILDETIIKDDIAAGAVETSEILNETILAEDIATEAIETSEIKNGTLLNEDIADKTINLSTKIASVSKNQILIGDTTNVVAAPKLKMLVGGAGISISQNADSVIVNSTLGSGGVESNGNITVNANTVNSGAVWISNVLNVTLTNGQVAEIGDLVLASIDKPLEGCILSAYIHGIQGDKIQVRISIYNPTNGNITFGNVAVKLLVVK